MEKFLMICYVAASFASPKKEIFSVSGDKLGTFIETPEWVKDTLLFKLLLRDGSIKVAENHKIQVELENDPMEGITAEGKAGKSEEPAEEPEAEEEPAEEEATEEKVERPKRTYNRKKKDDAE